MRTHHVRNRALKDALIIIFISGILFLNNTNLNNYQLESDKIQKIFMDFGGEFLIYIKKRAFILFVINRDLEVITMYKIAVGKKKNFLPKIHAGDNGTPEGLYYVKEILSMDADEESEEFIKLQRMNAVYFKAEDGHYMWDNPRMDAGKNVYGPRFFRLNYPNEKDKKYHKKLKNKGLIPKNKEGEFVGYGYGIGIHGTNDPVSIGHRISSGCVRMKNDQIVLLDRFIKMGTPVIIEK